MENRICLIKSFELYNIHQNSLLFYTSEVSAHIEDPLLISILVQIKENNIKEINEDILNELINHDSSSTLKQYLENDLKILHYSDTSNGFRDLVIYASDDEISNQLHKNFCHGYNINTYINPKDINFNDKTLTVVFYKNYSKKVYEDLYNEHKTNNSWIITSYIANNYLMIDNIYNNKKGMPCHFCNLQRHHALVSSQSNIKSTSWINFCRRMNTENNNDNNNIPSIAIDSPEKGLILFWLTKTINKLINPHANKQYVNELNKYHWVNLLSGESNCEQSVHWPYCKCLSEA